VSAQAAAWSPLVMVDQYVPALRSMRAIALDVGNQDPFVGTNTQLAESLTRLSVTQTFEVYDGDHGNRILQSAGGAREVQLFGHRYEVPRCRSSALKG
jgi:enterochelin esterase-like enzyme